MYGVLAPSNSEEEDQFRCETFYRSPAGNRSRPAKPGQQPGSESCVVVGRPILRSVDSEIKRCVIEPRNLPVVSLRLGQSRGPSQALATPGPTGVPGHTGVGGTWRMIARVLRERGRSWQFPEENRIRSNRCSKLRDDPSAMHLRPNGDETQTLQGIAKQRKRSAARRLSGIRSVS